MAGLRHGDALHVSDMVPARPGLEVFGVHESEGQTAALGTPQYRTAIAWQNVGYNQPPHPGFFLGDGMAAPPKPDIVHRDTLAPTFRFLLSSTDELWPPLGQMVPVLVIAQLVDLIDSWPTARIVNVTSNEPIEGDFQIIAPFAVLLRAERSGSGTGRVYTITVEGKDDAGNVASRNIEVRVPLRRHR